MQKRRKNGNHCVIFQSISDMLCTFVSDFIGTEEQCFERLYVEKKMIMREMKDNRNHRVIS
jgi:hypothetical protein